MNSIVNLITCFDSGAIANFINDMLNESKYCRRVIEKEFDKSFVMTK